MMLGAFVLVVGMSLAYWIGLKDGIVEGRHAITREVLTKLRAK